MAPSSLFHSAPDEGGDPPPSNSPALSKERRSSQNSVRISLLAGSLDRPIIPKTLQLTAYISGLYVLVFFYDLCLCLFSLVFPLCQGRRGGHTPPRYLVIYSIFFALENVFPRSDWISVVISCRFGLLAPYLFKGFPRPPGPTFQNRRLPIL